MESVAPAESTACNSPKITMLTNLNIKSVLSITDRGQ